jgi:hypothetical protein
MEKKKGKKKEKRRTSWPYSKWIPAPTLVNELQEQNHNRRGFGAGSNTHPTPGSS